MKRLYRFLFPAPICDSPRGAWALLFLRLIVGALFLQHGITKWVHASTLAHTFPSPIGLGSEVSLWLVIFAELFCTLAFMIGFLYRLALIPMIFDMGVVVFVMKGGTMFPELPTLYLTLFVLLYLTGPGRYSFDNYIRKRIVREKKPS